MNTKKLFIGIIIFVFIFSSIMPSISIYADDIPWTNLGGLPIGTNGDVNVTATAPNGDIYIGGSFTAVNGIQAKYFAVWDGISWHSMGADFNYYVSDIAFDSSGAVYVTGYNFLSKWDGNSWVNEGGTFSGDSRTLAIDSSDNVYVGGSSLVVGGESAGSLALWNGSSWYTEIGIEGYVYSLKIDSSDNVYVAGRFAKTGGVLSQKIAMWNGSSWSNFDSWGNSNTSTPLSMAVDDSDKLYVIGYFSTMDGIETNNIVMWDGSSWHDLANGLSVSPTGITFGLDNNLYISTYDNGIMQWNGVSFLSLGGELIQVFSLTTDIDGNLYIGGGFDHVDSKVANNIAFWNGQSWSGSFVGDEGLNSGTIYSSVIAPNGDLYIGGDIKGVSEFDANGILRWDGSSWHSVGNETFGSDWYGGLEVRSLAFDANGNLFAGGNFNSIGEIEANGIAMWNGSNWQNLGDGISIRYPDGMSVATVNTMAFGNDGNLYVGGKFTQAGSESVNGIAMWDGLNWHQIGESFDDENTQVLSIAFDPAGNLYISGDLYGITSQKIAMWTGSSWVGLGSGTSHPAQTLGFTSDGTLYAGGYFTKINGVSSNPFPCYLISWNGSSWSTVDAGIDGQINTLIIDQDDNIYVGGDFSTAGGGSAPRIARWDGLSWTGINDGFNGSVKTLSLTDDGVLYAGGAFTFNSTNTISMNHLAVYGGNTAPDVSGTPIFEVREANGTPSNTCQSIIKFPTFMWDNPSIGTIEEYNYFWTKNAAVSPSEANVKTIFSESFDITQEEVVGGIYYLFMQSVDTSGTHSDWGINYVFCYALADTIVTGESDGQIITKTAINSPTLTIDLPAGMSNDPIKVVLYGGTSTQTTAAGLEMIGSSFEIEAFSTVDNQEVTTFDKDYTITVSYTDEQLNGVEPQTLKIYYHNPSTDAWEALETSVVDEVNKTVSATINHMSEYALLGDKSIGVGDIWVDITGNSSYGLSAEIIDFGSLELTGTLQSADTSSTDWMVSDPTGTGAGWSLMVSSSNFIYADKTIPVSNFSIRLNDGTIETVAGNIQPASVITDWVALSTVARPILSAVLGNGMGSYSFDPEFKLIIPADAYAGSYTATVTVQMVSGIQ